MPQTRAPIHEQLFRIVRIVGLVLGFMVGIVAIVVIEIELGLDPGIWLSTVIVGIAVAIGIVAAVALVGGRMGERLVGDRIEVAMREKGATKWQHGRLTVGQEQMSFQPYAFQMRIPNGEPLELRVTHLGADTGRRPQLGEIWSVNPQLHIVDLETDQGPKELAALPSRLTELHVRLGQ